MKKNGYNGANFFLFNFLSILDYITVSDNNETNR